MATFGAPETSLRPRARPVDVSPKASEYTGPFESLYEEHEAMQGNRGHRAEYIASQAQASRALRDLERQGRGPGDTTIFGTSRNIFGRDRFETQDKNPMSNYRMQPRQTPSLAQIGPPRQRGMAGSGGFFPTLAGVGPDGTATGIQQMGNNFAGQREAFGMGLANIASGGAFTSDPNVKIQKFMDQGFSPDQAQRYVQATENTAARLAQDRFVYGDRINERGGTQETQATAATGEADPTADPNYIPPHLRYLMEQQRPVTTMNMGGLMALRPYMQQQHYNMGKQLAMRDMGVSV
jgi:hypothetical protein